ncbi:caspase family protein [Cylindrospermum sp. FACHB-282]|uniref:caspase family protein n=1 Tax=Cylindrospermum sp. FACHB-282 TaxID=2692794 RepID=UPI00168382B9|nr:caspase family protein [Cylindrospermum sp. FACHB-282]MBD2387385.1 caspase family protein [Cylindrospermum sp. FACHB-282]
MANYWAITIGINQYQLFQPLSCAQADAEALKDLLVTEAGFLPENCLLMSNTSPPIGDKSSYPTKENILLLLEELAATSWQPQDQLWLFFSGYGVNYKEKDYLMPVEANPDLVQETGIEMRSLMQSLQMVGLNVLLILDINRAFGTQADAPVGQEIIELAQELQLAAILSCQPEQFSHESSELGHGFFTAALLEALRSGSGTSLMDLESYLYSLTPKLCQHYWRPIQNPVTVIPSRQQTILPSLAIDSNLELDSVIYPEENFAIDRADSPLKDTAPKTLTADKAWWAEGRTVETTLSKISSGTQKSQNQEVAQPLVDSNRMLATSPELNTVGRFIPSSGKDYASPLPSNQVNTPLWKQFILWGGGSMVVVGLIATYFLRNQASFQIKELFKASPHRDLSDGLRPNLGDRQIINTLPKPRPITQNPAPVELNNPAGAQISSTPKESDQRNQALSDLEKMSLKATQAGDLSKAIATAQKIKSGEPLYKQSQDNIQIWSQMILDLAADRAKQREYANAIATAQLITQGEALYPQAQAAINQWRLEAKQYVSNKTLLEAANALIQPGQASTYNRAIEVAKKVPPGQPGFESAQKSINKWSEKILDLAKRRATQGELNAAIETAALVPEVTAAYEDAQDAIQKWQVRKIKN